MRAVLDGELRGVYENRRTTDLFEVMLGTGMRRGEILALRCSDVHLMDRKRYVRWTLAAIEQEKAMKPVSRPSRGRRPGRSRRRPLITSVRRS